MVRALFSHPLIFLSFYRLFKFIKPVPFYCVERSCLFCCATIASTRNGIESYMTQNLDYECVNGLGSIFDDAESSDEGGDREQGPALVEEVHVRGRHSAGCALISPPTLKLSLVSARHSLWGHRLWNAALLLAEMFDSGEISVEGKTVLELGAGAGLPGLVCALKGARKVVISDYATSTDKSLMVPIGINIDRIQPEFVPSGTLHAVGHVWGHPVDDLLEPLATRTRNVSSKPNRGGGGEGEEFPSDEPGRNDPPNYTEIVGIGEPTQEDERLPDVVDKNGSDGEGAKSFDVVIMADLLFNRSQHAQLLESCDRCLGKSETATVWVSFSHHDPQKTELDMKFFSLARLKGFSADWCKTVQMRDLFVEDDGMDHLRGEVHLWRLTREKSEG